MHSGSDQLQIFGTVSYSGLQFNLPTVNTPDNLFYLEYSIEKNGKYIFHLSFKTMQKTTEIFEKMQSWKMPVTLKQNRIILKEVVINRSRAEIHFSDKDHAKEFHDFIFPDLIKKRANVKLKNLCISFDSSAIINKVCFIDNRVMQPRIIFNQNESLFIAAFRALNSIENFPAELKKLILLLMIRTEDKHHAIREKFLLHTQNVEILANKIVNCEISYAYNPGCKGTNLEMNYPLYAFLTCTNPDDAEYLFNIIKLHGTFKEMELWRNRVVVKPARSLNSVYNLHSNGLMPYRDGLKINFINENDLHLCSNFINFFPDKNHEIIKPELKHESEKNSMIFNKSLLAEQCTKRFWETRKFIEKSMPERTSNSFADIDELINNLDPENIKNKIQNWSAGLFTSIPTTSSDKENYLIIKECLQQLKDYITHGLLDRMSLNEIVEKWKTSPALYQQKTVQQFILDSKNGEEILEQLAAIVKKHEDHSWFRPFFAC